MVGWGGVGCGIVKIVRDNAYEVHANSLPKLKN